MSDRGEDPGADFVPLGSYAVGLEVDSLQAFLESNGIMCFQRGGQVAATLRYGFYDVRLEVRRSDLDKARELETAFNQGLPGYPFRDGGEGTGGELEEGLGDDEAAGDEAGDDHAAGNETPHRRPSSKVEHEYAAPEPPLDAAKVSRRALVPAFGAASFAAGQRLGGVVVALAELGGLALLISGHLFAGASALVGGLALDFFGSRNAVHHHNELQRRRAERRATDGRLLGR
ncbi:MAG: DUF2007 domain-containing protein [Deltaproteobacteria bacterium]|nr:DUF2007 domain-containing protein [Deltaproteobacteria bacterium]